MTILTKIHKWSRQSSFGGSPWTAPLLLFVVAGLSYGWMLTSLGFYWDDWPKAWFLHLLGPSGFHSVYAIDRPFLAYTYLVTTPILGETPLPWHLFALVCSWGSAVALWLLVRSVWPRQEGLAIGAALLSLTYPGFTQQSIALIYSHYFLILMTFLLSLMFMVRAMKSPHRRWVFYGLAIALSAYSHFSIEYFVGLEILRPLLLWRALGSDEMGWRHHLRKVIVYMIPFLLVDVGFLVWRVRVIQFPTYEPLLLDQFVSEPLKSAGKLLPMIPSDLLTVSVRAWAQAFRISDLLQAGPRGMVFSAAAILLTVISVSLYWVLFKKSRPVSPVDEPSHNPSRDYIQIIMAGSLALFGAGWPFWITDLPIGLQFSRDRFTLPMILGVSWVIGGVLYLLVRKFELRILLLSVLVGLGAGRQVFYSNEFRLAWETQRRFFWEMSWRIPDLEEGTTILTNDFPTLLYSDNSLTAPLNWIYAPDHDSPQMPYMLYFLSVRLGLGLPALEEGLPIQQTYRATTFVGSTSQILVLMYEPPGCLHVLDEVLDDSLTGTPDGISEAVPLSDLDLIDTAPKFRKQPPIEVFGDEPEHGWCYFYEKADLARQRQDWEEIVHLGEIAFALSDRPNNASERIPFIEGYAHRGNWDRAVELSLAVLTDQPQMNRLVCKTWARLLNLIPATPARDRTAAEIKAAASCDQW